MELVLSKIQAIKILRVLSTGRLVECKHAIDWAFDLGEDLGTCQEYILVGAIFLVQKDGKGAIKACVETGNMFFGHIALEIMSPPEKEG